MEFMGVDKAIQKAKTPYFEVLISRERKKRKKHFITLLYFKQKLSGNLKTGVIKK